jgi:hypothetical protein
MVHVTAIVTSEIVIFVAIVAQGYIIGIDGDVTGVEKSVAMAAGVVVTGTVPAYKPMIIIDSHNVYIGHEFVAIVTIGIVVITAIFTDIIAITYMVLSSP